ncbi:MAG: hypothetical protein DHS20C21_04630 [Gemmatimonadota bacterium]|nr:MAG: hypothetical protein DHS20C21_04630 [Gemmatimonadota bacterium]
MASVIWKLAISAALVTWLGVRYAGDQQFLDTLRSLDPWAFVSACGVVAAGLVISALRWKVLLGALGVSLALPRAVRLYFVGYFFNQFLPTTVGGDVVRGTGVGAGVPLSLIGSSILMERALGFGCLLGIGVTASFVRPEMAAVRLSLLFATLVYVVGLGVLGFVPLPRSERQGRLGKGLRGLRRVALQFRSYGFHPMALLGGVVLSLGWQLALVVANALLSQGLGGVASFRSLLALVPVVQAVSMIPVSFGGLGVREMGYEFFFRASALEPAGGVALAAGFLGVTITLALAGGLVYLIAPVRPREVDGG